MHMADAWVSPTVGGTTWLASAGVLAWCSRQLRQAQALGLVPLMGVLGAFVFAAQMINFSLPAAGSSGHLGGALLLAVLLGPYAAFLVIASVLTLQALLFQDGGLLALGCNLFNLGFFPAFVAYPLVYRPIQGHSYRGGRAWVAAVAAAVVGLQLGSCGVVVETWLSGVSALPLKGFIVLMQSVHLAIGIAEGIATAAVVAFVAEARPEALAAAPTAAGGRQALRRALLGLALAAAALGGAASWFASTRPDGLEWSIASAAGNQNVAAPTGRLHAWLAAVQRKTAILPDYGFGRGATDASADASVPTAAWPAVSTGTSVSGLVGAALTLAIVVLLGVGLRARRGRTTGRSTPSAPGA
jgi:cobalt/nickel transport system permease protein